MEIEQNEKTVAELIAKNSEVVLPLAIKIKDFNVKSLTEDEVEVSLERLKTIGVVKKYRHGWGSFIKNKKSSVFEWTGEAPLFKDNGDSCLERTEHEIYEIDFDLDRLKKYLESPSFKVIPNRRTIERQGEDYYCGNSKIDFDTYNSYHYYIFEILYGSDGTGKFLSYEAIDEELVKRYGLPKNYSRKKIIERIKNALHNGLYRQAKNNNIKKYVQIREREGVKFINPRY